LIVKELIEKLQSYPPEMRVLGRGYESGYNDIDDVEMFDVHHCTDNPWYDGEYQDIKSYNEGEHQQLTVVTLT